MDLAALAEVPNDELRLQLEADERLIARARARQAARVVELDRRQADTAAGCASMSEWLAGQLDVTPETAKDLAATATALARLPHLRGAVGDGEVSWDRTVEVAGAATPDDELEVLLESYDHDLAGFRRRRSRRRRMTRHEERDVFAGRHFSMQEALDHNAWRVSGLLPAIMGQALREAVDARADEFGAFPDGTRAPLSQRRADALVTLVSDSSTGGDDRSAVVTVHVDAARAAPTNAETGVTLVAGSRIGPDALEAVLCDAVTDVTADASDGTPLGIGRRSRTIPPRLRRHVLARDGGCTVAGCVSAYRLQAHHRVPYSEGGRTDPDNLTTLCWYHHHVVVHGHGFTIDPGSPRGRLRLEPPQAARPPPEWAVAV